MVARQGCVAQINNQLVREWESLGAISRKEVIDNLRSIANKYHDALAVLIKNCKHVANNEEDTCCAICGIGLGWRCENSPDGVCHYHSNNHKVTLVNGNIAILPDDYDDNFESDDWCVFCGEPYERK